MNNKEHATAILSKLLFRERVKIDGEYDYLADTEICEKIITDYLNDKYTPAVSIVMRSLQEKKKAYERELKANQNSKEIEEGYMSLEREVKTLTRINLYAQIVNDLEEIINQNFA